MPRLYKKNIAGVEKKGIPDGLPAGRQARSRGVLFEASTGGNESETGPAKILKFRYRAFNFYATISKWQIK
ncbi:hypothetical protein COY13_04225 [Candidatus Roizmanbacteria bacterium CG_4_10_14_0_2_um_filter_36_35]|uniref:Uncharacterized protein n=2 Tax=Candidatus Roizmaniibacteriota TaxID=1752723 RepID=A0A2M7U740_9BACT|nr:MAG: hypothetical protein COV86_02860 [Candidatus Roizmanbacteria bacterium CG11_big_fil_rev_8_21_14_0_20_35_14]PIZ67022.1 MAG: hypothetical protein COY13_04225 [Candidatus Roizmanbacteria bacterium CG_4_10_14_0_2_um_filter_36_35]PJC80577.1 MAG: hypothetical protein CO008_01525 [Candidatus Roizmanbacteria bacterium CG_4_8_14_3_um_filter_36_12]